MGKHEAELAACAARAAREMALFDRLPWPVRKVMIDAPIAVPPQIAAEWVALHGSANAVAMIQAELARRCPIYAPHMHRP